MKSYEFLIFLVIILLFELKSTISQSYCCISTSEYNALFDFYNSLNGNSWDWMPTSTAGSIWNFTISNACDPCSDPIWQGLSCSYISGSSCSIYSIILNEYNLNGVLPESISNFTSLQVLNVVSNSIKGSLPLSMKNITTLINLDFYDNQMTGKALEIIAALPNLADVTLDGNNFFGTIPYEISKLTAMYYFSMNFCIFSGTIPAFLNAWNKLQAGYFQGNVFSKSLPFELFNNWPDLLIFEIGGNFLDSTLPSSLGNLTSLTTFSINYDMFTGPFPETLSNLIQLTSIAGLNNYLSGSLSSSFSKLINLESLNIQYNHLTGTIPADYEQLTSLTALFINSNHLSGTFPVNVSTLSQMSQFCLSHNEFTGSITNMFNKSKQFDLTQICINNNFFTGQLPTNLFGLFTLNQFVASVNCFSEITLTEEICQSSNLVIFALDGASSATRCQEKIFPKLSLPTYTLGANRGISGSIPDCIYAMPNLAVLHLAGNNIISRLHPNITISSVMNTLVLSHNQITGEIPTSISNHTWSDLDLSYNKVTGLLSKNFHNQIENETSITLNNNHLSGIIPNSLLSLQNIDILKGNIFYCEDYKPSNNLPIHDDDYSSYSCGSNSFNDILYTFITIWFVNFLILCIFIYYQKFFCLSFQNYLLSSYVYKLYLRWKTIISSSLKQTTEIMNDSYQNEFEPIRLSSIHYHEIGMTIHLLDQMRFISLIIFLIVLIIFLPIYSGLHVSFSNYIYLYAWTISPLYLTGKLPTYLLFIFWFCFISILFFITYLWKTEGKESSEQFEGFRLKSTEVLSEQSMAAKSLKSLIALLYSNPIESNTNSSTNPSNSEQKQSQGSTDENDRSQENTHSNVSEDDEDDEDDYSIASETSKNTTINASSLTVSTAAPFSSAARKGRGQSLSKQQKLLKKKQEIRKENIHYAIYLLILFLLNISVVIVINGLFVYISLNYSGGAILTMEFILAIFKLIWTPFIIYYFSLTTIYIPFYGIVSFTKQNLFSSPSLPPSSSSSSNGSMSSSSTSPISTTTTRTSSSSSSSVAIFLTYWPKIILLIFNNVAIPILVSMIIDSNCFYNAFVNAPNINVSINEEECIQYDCTPPGSTNCICTETEYTYVATRFVPPYIYLYQCSSSFIVNYIPVFAFSLLFDSIFLPLRSILVDACLILPREEKEEKQQEKEEAEEEENKRKEQQKKPVDNPSLDQKNMNRHDSVDSEDPNRSTSTPSFLASSITLDAFNPKTMSPIPSATSSRYPSMAGGGVNNSDLHASTSSNNHDPEAPLTVGTESSVLPLPPDTKESIANNNNNNNNTFTRKIKREFHFLKAFFSIVVYDDITRPFDTPPQQQFSSPSKKRYPHSHKKHEIHVDRVMLGFIFNILILFTWGMVFPPLAFMSTICLFIRSYHIQVAIGWRYLHGHAAQVNEDCNEFQPYLYQALRPILLMNCAFCSFILFDTLGNGSSVVEVTFLMLFICFGPMILAYLIFHFGGRSYFYSNVQQRKISHALELLSFYSTEKNSRTASTASPSPSVPDNDNRSRNNSTNSPSRKKSTSSNSSSKRKKNNNSTEDRIVDNPIHAMVTGRKRRDSSDEENEEKV